MNTPLACEDCGKLYSDFALDVVLSNDQWHAIQGREGGVLCAACIVERGSKLPGVTVAKLHFPDLASPAIPPGYDRELIARMLFDYSNISGGRYEALSARKRAQLISEADNATGGAVTVNRSPAGEGGLPKFARSLDGQRTYARGYYAGRLKGREESRLATTEQPAFPKCSGNPASCPENEGRGCCKRNDGSPWPERPGSAVQGENREQEAAAIGNILRRFSAELSLHERASLTIAVQVLSGTTPPPAPAAEQEN